MMTILVSLAILVMLIASYTDLRWREVPDWLNFAFIAAVLGIRMIFSVEQGWSLFLDGVLGGAIAFLIAAAFYYTDQWGGGDSKLLIGIGALYGFSWPVTAHSFMFFAFILTLLFVGAGYGLVWLLYLSIAKRSVFSQAFRRKRIYYRKEEKVVAILSIVLTLFAINLPVLWPLIFFPIGIFYVFLFVGSVEDSCFVKNIKIQKLTEGDWLIKRVVVKGKTIVKPKTLVRKDILLLEKHSDHITGVMIKEGIPFVPSFLIAFLILTFLLDNLSVAMQSLF